MSDLKLLLVILEEISGKIPYQTSKYDVYANRRIYLERRNKIKAGYISFVNMYSSILLHFYSSYGAGSSCNIVISLSDPNLISNILSAIQLHHDKHRITQYNRRRHQNRVAL